MNETREQPRSRGTSYVAMALLAVAACALVSCSRGPVAGTNAARELRIGIVSDPRSLNPLFVTAQSDVDISQLYTETLVGLSPRNKLIPLLADPVPSRANGGISRDGLTITYHLRRNARFSDGYPVTSKDVAFTYHVILDPRNPVTDTDPYRRRIASLRTPDAHTVVIRLVRPWFAAVTELFAVSDWVYGILPAHLFHGADIAASPWNERPIGSGPFRVVHWRRGDEILLEPNPYAWRRPRLRRLAIKILPDQTTLFVALRTHDVDVAALTEEEVLQARGLSGIRLTRTPANHTTYLEFQVQRPPMNDPLVRRALVEGIDRERIRKSVFLGLQRLATTEIPPVFSAHDSSLNRTYQPRRAADDLDRAGWHLRNGIRYKNGRPLSLLFAYVSTSAQAR
ncbi:MAG: ABC transporter substrate-binding protein, partial [Rhodanobacteraceae bacterium]